MRRGTRAHGEDQESYFASMSDLMAGIVFIFLIMLMALSMYNIEEATKTQDQPAEKTYQDTIDTIMEERARMVEALRQDLAARHIEATADAANGILRLPAPQFFASGAAALKPEGREKLAAAAALLARYLTCTPQTPDLPAGACPRTAPVDQVDTAIANTTPPSQGMAPETMARIQALEISAALTSAQPTLYELHGRAGQPMLAVRGTTITPPAAPKAVTARHGHRPAPAAPTTTPPITAPAADQLTLTFTMALPARP
ncbi:hypothetical protein [Nitrospirillum iridis]|uniref:OmpA-like domain-containing protein n=1 Tax=Nitrospirillum iridis TaxID=765888 RepID=A0A7X0EE99_9PROT|nr:hypothetical protein [Nitrospirillum iridis]MBB6252825.1 hypothetical protein [Nitrospirillum iridis]